MFKKSKVLRKVFVKTPGGKTVVRQKPKTGSIPHCPVTGQRLIGIKKARSAQLKKMSKSEKTVARPFGGSLSSWASRRRLISKARSQ